MRANVSHLKRKSAARYKKGSADRDAREEAESFSWRSRAPRFEEQDKKADDRGSESRSEDLRRAYALLEIPLGSGPDEVRAAHRRLLAKYHPDRFARDDARQSDATRLSQELTAARDFLLLRLGAASRE